MISKMFCSVWNLDGAHLIMASCDTLSLSIFFVASPNNVAGVQ